MFQVLELLGQGKSGTEIAKAVLTEHKLEQVPVGIKEWMLLAEFLLARTELARRNEEPWMEFTHNKLPQYPQKVLDRLTPCFVRLRDAIPIILKSRIYSEDLFAMPGERSRGDGSFERIRVLQRY